MKNILYFVCSFILFSIFACQPEQGRADLFAQVESCMDNYPDSGLRLLRRVSHPERFTGEMQAKYAVLMTQATDNNYLPMTSDSLINIAVAYFQNENEPVWRAKNLFYKGRVYAENSEYGNTLVCYLQGIDALQNIKEEYKIHGLLYRYISQIYHETHLYAKSISFEKKALLFFQQAKDSTLRSVSEQIIARNYLLMSKLDSVAFHLEIASRMADDDRQRLAVTGDWQAFYQLQGKDQESEETLLRLATHKYPIKRDWACSCISLGKYYLNAGEWENQTEIIDVHAKYNHGKVEHELFQTQSQNRWLAIMAVSLMLLLFFVVYCYVRYRKYKQLELSRTGSALRRKELELEQKQTEIGTFRAELEMLRAHDNATMDRYIAIENVLRQKEEELIVLQSQVDCIETKLKKHKLVSIVKTNFPNVNELDIRALSVFQSLQSDPCKNAICTAEDWELLFLWTDIAHFRFYTRLKEKYGQLKKRDFQICCLIRLGFDNDAIRTILDIQQTTLYTDKSRAKKKMSLESTEVLEEFLRNF